MQQVGTSLNPPPAVEVRLWLFLKPSESFVPFLDTFPFAAGSRFSGIELLVYLLYFVRWLNESWGANGKSYLTMKKYFRANRIPGKAGNAIPIPTYRLFIIQMINVIITKSSTLYHKWGKNHRPMLTTPTQISEWGQALNLICMPNILIIFNHQSVTMMIDIYRTHVVPVVSCAFCKKLENVYPKASLYQTLGGTVS